MSKVWLITGAARGMGIDITWAAMQAGDQVVATARNPKKLREIFKDAPSEQIHFVGLDVTQPDQARSAVEEAVKRFGRLDVVVNNAGICLLGYFEETPVEDMKRQLDTNFYGAVHVMQAALPVLRQQRSGHILNISSVAGDVGTPTGSLYSASKFALQGLSLSVMQEVERFGIKVTLVEPGFFRTELLTPDSAWYAPNTLEDYGQLGDVKASWEVYNGQQPGDPAKLGRALVEVANMEHPPRHFLVGRDAVQVVRAALEERLQEIQGLESLSTSTDLTN